MAGIKKVKLLKLFFQYWKCPGDIKGQKPIKKVMYLKNHWKVINFKKCSTNKNRIFIVSELIAITRLMKDQ